MKRDQPSPTITGTWQVLDLETGEATYDGLLQMTELTKEQAVKLANLLNELDKA